jgi:hypothetical protein
MLKGIGRTARSLNWATHPRIAEQFRLPRSRGYPALRGAAQPRHIMLATPIKQAFVDLALPAEFLDELEDLTDAFAKATVQKNDGLFALVGGTAALFRRGKNGEVAAFEQDAIVRNAFRNNHGAGDLDECPPHRAGATRRASGDAAHAAAVGELVDGSEVERSGRRSVSRRVHLLFGGRKAEGGCGLRWVRGDVSGP